MKQFLNTIFITQPGTLLSLKNENLCFHPPGGENGRVPLTIAEQILVFTAQCECSLELMHYCAAHGIGLHFFTAQGKHRFSVSGETRGNVLLRKAQYETAGSEKSVSIARAMLSGKLQNSRYLLKKYAVEYNDSNLAEAAAQVQDFKSRMEQADTLDSIRGIEGAAASVYFSVFDRMIHTEHAELRFSERNRRPPLDSCNAMLSFAYSLLAVDCRNALEAVGLDPQMGVNHTLRPGKPSLALDLMEELRPTIADRFVLRLINLRMVTPEMFEQGEDMCSLNEDGRGIFFREWNRMRKRSYTPDGMDEAYDYALLPHLQAQRLAQVIRGEESEYRPLIWR